MNSLGTLWICLIVSLGYCVDSSSLPCIFCEQQIRSRGLIRLTVSIFFWGGKPFINDAADQRHIMSGFPTIIGAKFGHFLR